MAFTRDTISKKEDDILASLNMNMECTSVSSGHTHYIFFQKMFFIWGLFYILYSFFWSHMALFNWFLHDAIQFFIWKTTRPPSCLTNQGTNTTVGLGCSSIFIFLIDELFGSPLNLIFLHFQLLFIQHLIWNKSFRFSTITKFFWVL